MLPQEKNGNEQHGMRAGQQTVAKSGYGKAMASSLLSGVGVIVLMVSSVFVVLAGYLYLSRVHLLHPVTGTWVGTMSSSEGAADRRVVYVDTSVSLIHWYSPTLTGTVRMCNKQRETEYALQRTNTASDDTLGITLVSAEAPDSGELFGALRDDHLSSFYNGTDPELQGQLHRGSLQAYQQSCSELRQ